MTSVRCARTAKSAVAAVLSLSLFLTSAGWPASQAFAQAMGAGEGGLREAPNANAGRVVALTLDGVALDPSGNGVSSELRPGIVANAGVASATEDSFESAPKIAEIGSKISVSPRALASSHDAGPRWVRSVARNVSVKAATASAQSGAWLRRQLVRLRGADARVSREEFDGVLAGRASGAEKGGVSGALTARASALPKPKDEIARVLSDVSIPTPEAARRVGELRRQAGTPLWAKVVAPLAVIAAVSAAVHFGAVGVLTLGAGLVLSVLAHEVSHIAVLRALGDRTAEHAGSHSLNPFLHIDAIKTVIMPALSLAVSSVLLPFPVLIGAAKPVDVDFNNLRGPLGGPRSARNAFWVAAAGPLTNFALAGLALGAAALLPAGGILAVVALGVAHMNAALGIFNLLPLPQLDGGKMITSRFPESWYTKMVFNPRFEKKYQGLFRRLYEGPTNLLTFIGDQFGVKDQTKLNRFANGATFAALAVFYAVAYFHFSIRLPMLFFALPCTYDYYCIREKVRSDAAVEDIMNVMNGWSFVIAQISEELDVPREVKAFDLEHAMKNALENFVDELMARDDFKALSDEEKTAKFMAEYPEKAAEYLKLAAMTELELSMMKPEFRALSQSQRIAQLKKSKAYEQWTDAALLEAMAKFEKMAAAGDFEKLMKQYAEVLADPRNAPYLARLAEWFPKHDVFARWNNPKYKGELRKQLDEVEKPESQSQGADVKTYGLLGLMALLGGASLIFPDLAHHAPGLMGLAMAAGFIGAPGEWFQKIFADPSTSDFRVVFRPGVGFEEARKAMASYSAHAISSAGQTVVFQLTGDSASYPTAALLAQSDIVARVDVPAPDLTNEAPTEISPDVNAEASQPTSPDVNYLVMPDGHPAAKQPEAPARAVNWFAKLEARSDAGLDADKEVRVRFAPSFSLSAAEKLMKKYPGAHSLPVGKHILFTVPVGSEEAVAKVARELAVQAFNDRVYVPRAVYDRLHASESVLEAGAKEIDSRGWEEKIVEDTSLNKMLLRVTLTPGLSPEVREKTRAVVHSIKGVSTADFEAEGVLKVIVLTPMAEAAAGVREIAGLKVVESVAASSALKSEIFSVPLPAKIKAHEQKQWSTGAVLVRFAPETAAADIQAALAKQTRRPILRHEDAYVVFAGGAAQAASAAVEFAKYAFVTGVEVHPNVAAAMEKRAIVPVPAAESYDPAHGVLVQFKADATGEQIASFAELRGLRVVYPEFSGDQTLALMEIPDAADAAATRQMLADETLDEGSLVVEIKPVMPQLGEAPTAPSAAALARAETRRAADEIEKEAAAHPPRRDPQVAWAKFLQNERLQDGSTLDDTHARALTLFTPALAASPDKPRVTAVARTALVKQVIETVTSAVGTISSMVLIGEPGVGKTMIAEGLADMLEEAEHAVASGSDHYLKLESLMGHWMVNLHLERLLGAEDPVKTLTAIVDSLPRFNDRNPTRGNKIILLIDEIQKLFEHPKGQQLINTIMNPLRDGELAVIATTTEAKYKEHFLSAKNDNGIERRFETKHVDEPTVAETIRMLRVGKEWFQQRHDAIIDDAALVAAAKLSDQYDKTHFNPDKAAKAIHKAANRARPEKMRDALTMDIREVWNDLIIAVDKAREVLLEKGIASTLALPIETYNEIAELIKKAQALYLQRDAVADGKGRVTVDLVKRAIAERTRIDAGQLNIDEKDAARYNEMEKVIGAKVINQDGTVSYLADAVRRDRAGLKNPNVPLAKVLLIGSTGVGKTQLAKEMADFLFDDPEAMIRIDLSEYQEKHTVSRLIGSPPGYVGFEAGGQLTNEVRKKPYSVVLFDEIEKAHPDVLKILLQVMDDGRLTDGQGRTTDFKNTLIILSSNLGAGNVDTASFVRELDGIAADAKLTAEERAVRNADVQVRWNEATRDAIAEAIPGVLSPEFLNRMDQDPSSNRPYIIMNRLRRQDMAQIAQIQLKHFERLVADRHDADLIVDPSVVEFLSEAGFSHEFGARPMAQAIMKHVVNPMAKRILKEMAEGGKGIKNSQVTVSYDPSKSDGEKLGLKVEPKPVKDDIGRTSLKDAAALMAAEVFSLIERLAGEGDGEEPTDGVFDKMLRAVLPAAGPAKGEAPPVQRVFFAPDTALAMPAGARIVLAANNGAKEVDPAVRAEIKAVSAVVAAAGWPESVASALIPPPGQRGEGWVKQIAAFAKERAEAAGAAAPIEIVSAIDGERVRVLVHSDAPLSDSDKAFLNDHFAGEPPANYEAAQQLVHALAPTATIMRDYNLLDLSRRARAVPGARMGYVSGAAARGGKGSDLWLEIRKEKPKPAAAIERPAVSADLPVSPDRLGKMAPTRELIMGFIDQSRLKAEDRDGLAIQIAAAESYARLATPAEAAQARRWFEENRWTAPGADKSVITSKYALALTAALILKRFGGAEDIPLLEAMSRKLTDYGHDQAPLHSALVDALAGSYARAGLAELRRAQARVPKYDILQGLNNPDHNPRDMIRAVSRALGSLGYPIPADMKMVEDDSVGLAEFYRRMGKADAMRDAFYDREKWSKLNSNEMAATFALIAEVEPTDETFERLGRQMTRVDRVTRHHAAQAWADLVARDGRTKGLAAAIGADLEKHGVKAGEEWEQLYAHVLAAEQAGGPELLAPLETLLSADPRSIHASHEQTYFSAPEAWANTLIRNGLYQRYAARTMSDAVVQSSRLETMLIDKEHPMMVAAAIRAIALGQKPPLKPAKAAGPEKETPKID